MSRDLFSRAGLDLLKRSLDAYSLRQKVIAENVAHAETPGYRSRSVSFEAQLQAAIGSRDSLAMSGQERGHQPGPVSELAPAQVLNRSERALDNGVNDVSIDLEMAALAENSLRHKLVSRIMAARYQALRSAIRGRGQ